MVAEFVIAGRRALPGKNAPWYVELESHEGSVSVYTVGLDQFDYVAHIRDLVGFEPLSVVLVRKAWGCAQVVAEVIAGAVEGVVFCDVDCMIIFDAKSKSTAYESRNALAKEMRRAFDHPEPFFERWAREANEPHEE